ncbi:hypothetical protein BDF19DRAFT_451239 [Syncephalis fuscata]|nr:hypothetical protein BDF19DRAFT_451239 [Syncephalis fuscata]
MKLVENMAATFESTILRVHNEALSNGALLFTPTTTEILHQDGVASIITSVYIEQFNVRLAPKKPFLPYEKQLLVEELPHHVVLLNKYCVVPGHILVVTKEFNPQTNPPNAEDFAAVWSCMRRMHTRQFVAFYNCGKASGASQPHKHLQLLPIPADETISPPIYALIEKYPSSPDVPFRVPELNFVHACAHLSLDTTVISHDTASNVSPTPEQHDIVVGRFLHRTFLALANAINLATGAPSDDIAFRSYNLILTRNFILVVPRKHEITQGIAVNSLGIAGLFLANSHQQMNILKHSSVLRLFQALTFADEADMLANPQDLEQDSDTKPK